jgi:phage tail sheath protein FI
MPSTNVLAASKVAVVETPPSVQTIQGVPTAIVGFVGITKRGPIGTPQFFTNFKQFVKAMGSYLANSFLPQAVQGAFENGATQVWVSRTCHYTDPADATTATAAKGSLTLKDRGATAAKAVVTSLAGPFALKVGDVIEVKFEGGAANTITLSATPATVTTGNQPRVLADLETLIYQVKLPGSTALTRQHTIIFHTGDFSNIAAATAAEIAAAINKDPECVGIKASVNGTAVDIKSDKKGSGASIVIVGGTAVTPLGLTNGTTNGTGNVADVEAVDATELASLLTALPLSPVDSTAVASAGRLVLTGHTAGAGGSVQVTSNTTAVGVFSQSVPFTVNGSNNAQVNTITVTAKDPGTWITEYDVRPGAATNGDATRFNLQIVKTATGEAETHYNLSMDPNDARYFEDVVNNASELVTVTDLLDAVSPPSNMPAVGTFSGWSGQNDGLAGLVDADFAGTQAGRTGVYALDTVDNLTILCVPDRATAVVHNAMSTYCEVSRQRATFAVLDTPAGLTGDDGQGVVAYKKNAGLSELSEEAALFWPRIRVTNPSTALFGTADTVVVPPSGHIAGLMSRNDASKPGGIYEAPAGLLNNYGVLFGAVGVEDEQVNDEAVRDVVYPERINPICRIDGSPVHIDGNRTLKSTGDFPTIAERRGASYIEQSCKKGVRFAKHRNNDRRLRQEVQETLKAFLLRQYHVGAFRGATPAESFYVDVSDQLNPEESVFAGEMNVGLGIATQKPTDWIILDFTQDTRALDERLAQITAGTTTNDVNA